MAIVALRAESRVAEQKDRSILACERQPLEEEMPPLWAILLLPVMLMFVGLVVGIRKFVGRLTV
ncbi:MAG TPA: hypothetical protein VM008_15515 [Phycisphaerae bacterium]|nr:hypothetical protein [Phycisphaerae bacterium]